ncbi:hypothetical protein PPACK8108_LOCUS682 [Phakopsora pachyrhizi]|uniref:Uncharacterized protein n=1 Tax=Phakopsora pachyrhizi TaxID=170000 RepID=A0AAV0AI07_PHAPC|nr:hypothetical protein PPACK8108_LOCUS682 [Phakopsora pachyrhizi]
MVQDEKRFKKDVGGAIGLGIFRSNYLLHCSDPDSKITEGRKGINGPGLEIKQVEFNTVSVSFAALATKVSGLHWLPCDRILDQKSLDEDSMRLYYLIDGADRFEVSVIYYCSMYGPEDFMTEVCWLARYRLERSQLVKCPSLLVQLAGCKKFQQVLTDENFVCDHLYLNQSGVMNKDEFEEIKSTWVDILDFDGGRSSLSCQLGTNHKSSTSYVLKPQELFVHNSHLYKCLVAFLGFGNGAPDMFSTFVAMRYGTGSLAIGELIGAASFIVSVVLGSMFLIKTFQVDQNYSPGI